MPQDGYVLCAGGADLFLGIAVIDRLMWVLLEADQEPNNGLMTPLSSFDIGSVELQNKTF